MLEQATSFGAMYEYGDVEKVDADKKVYLSDGTVVEAKAVIVATGTKERLLNIPGKRRTSVVVFHSVLYVMELSLKIKMLL